MKILLHACCGPCSLEPTRLLQEQGDEFTLFFANPNIHPASEYQHRRETLQDFAQKEGFSVVEGTYDVDAWEKLVGSLGQRLEELRIKAGITDEVVESPNPYPLPSHEKRDPETDEIRKVAARLRKARCRACYRLRFREAACYAANHGFDAVGSTLSLSPFQYTEAIREELELAAEEAGIQSAFVDYRPFFRAAEERSKKLGMYRQNYCGCRFSDKEAQLERAVRKAVRKAKKQTYDKGTGNLS